MGTYFKPIYDSFLSKITDDMYMELTKEETEGMLQELLLSAIPHFEFPRVGMEFTQDDLGEYYFISDFTFEEVNILATYMVVEWIGQQLASVENTRMKYSGSAFKFTSQANHMQKLLQIKKDYDREGFHLQRLYKRRKLDKNGVYRSTMSSIMEAKE